MKPMLAAATTGENISYPVLTSPKLDGIRCLILNGVAVSRSLKPIPNKYAQHLFSHGELNGLDGELIVGGVTDKQVFNHTTSGVMSHEGHPSVMFYVFDDMSDPSLPFKDRLLNAAQRVQKNKYCVLVGHKIVDDGIELAQAEESALEEGFEGLMIRDPNGEYKFGRSTLKQGWLLKLKRFEDAEAEIIGYEELMHNANVAKTNELGYKERSHKKSGLVGRNQLGALKVRDVKTGIEFGIGTGFTEFQRNEYWLYKKELIGRLVKYKYQPAGVKEAPRFPVFIGFRDRRDS